MINKGLHLSNEYDWNLEIQAYSDQMIIPPLENSNAKNQEMTFIEPVPANQAGGFVPE